MNVFRIFMVCWLIQLSPALGAFSRVEFCFPSLSRENQDYTFDDQKERTWTSGKHKVRARLVEVKGDRVVLLKADGKRKTVPLNVLSKRDQSFVTSLLREVESDDSADEDDWGIDENLPEGAKDALKEMKKRLELNGMGGAAERIENEMKKRFEEAEERRRARRNNPQETANSFNQLTPKQPARQPTRDFADDRLSSSNSRLNGPGSSSTGKTITNQQFGFSVTIPGRFHAWNNAPVDIPDKLYLFEDSTTDNWNAADLVIIRRLRTKLNKLSMQIPPSMRNGAHQTTEMFVNWNGRQIKAFRQLEHLPEGDYLSYIVPFDLPKEAVQLVVGGPPEDDFRIRQTMNEIVSSFKQLNTGASTAANSSGLLGNSDDGNAGLSGGIEGILSSPERVYRISRGIGRLAGFILVGILIFVSIRGKMSAKKKPRRRY